MSRYLNMLHILGVFKFRKRKLKEISKKKFQTSKLFVLNQMSRYLKYVTHIKNKVPE
jgi:uncharacterized short protein YbdD (DUF466 family)